jgi:quercetin dioxygenase-like cupin family protein
MSAVRGLHLASTFAVLGPDLRATPVEVTPRIFQELNERFHGFKDRVLVSQFSFDADWTSWERHPAGDEIVCLLAGEATFVIDRDGVREEVRVSKPGSYVIVPKGVWHTARTSVHTTMIFVTPGEGTENKPV